MTQDKQLKDAYAAKFGKNPGIMWDDAKIQSMLDDSPPPPAGGGLVTMSKQELQDLIDSRVKMATKPLQEQNDVLAKQTQGGWKEFVPPKDRNKTARMRLWRKDTDQEFGVIIDWKHLKFDYDEATRKYDKDIYKINILKADGTHEEHEIPLIEFSKMNDFETVEILKSDKKTMIKSHGDVYVSGVDKNGYTMAANLDRTISGFRTSTKVPMNEMTTTCECLIRRPNGQELTISNTRLNS